MARCYTTTPARRDHQHRSDHQFRDHTREDQFDDHGGPVLQRPGQGRGDEVGDTSTVRSGRCVVPLHTRGESVALPASA
jgi:hypothetical protein